MGDRLGEESKLCLLLIVCVCFFRLLLSSSSSSCPGLKSKREERDIRADFNGISQSILAGMPHILFWLGLI